MKKGLSRVLVSSMAMMLVFSSVPILDAQAVDHATVTAETPDSPEKKAVEVVEERTDREMVYDNQDGMFTKQIYTEPINVKEDGDWELFPIQ